MSEVSLDTWNQSVKSRQLAEYELDEGNDENGPDLVQGDEAQLVGEGEEDNDDEEEETKQPERELLIRPTKRVPFARLLFFLFRVVFTLIFIILASLYRNILWSSIEAWRWCTFGAIVAASWDLSFNIILALILHILEFWVHNSAVKNIHYYLSRVRGQVSIFLCSIFWLVSWWALIILSPPDDSWINVASYITKAFGSLVLFIFLILIASTGKEVAESTFERTTHWNDIERMLKVEYFLGRIAGQGTLFPNDIVAGFVLMNSRLTKNDPTLLRACSRYIARSPVVLLDSSGDVLEVGDIDDARTFATITFNRLMSDPHENKSSFLEDFKKDRSRRKASEKQAHNAYAMMMHGRSRFLKLEEIRRDISSDSLLEMQKIDLATIDFEKIQGAYSFAGPLPPNAPTVSFGWGVLDPVHRGTISGKSFRRNVTNFFQDRLNFAATLRDAHTSVERLGMVFYSVALVLGIIFTTLIFAGSNSSEVWIGLTSFFVTVAVIFGSSLSQLFENIIFLFFRHAFDVGDLIYLNNDYYSVRRLELLSTLLLKWSGEYMLVENSWISHQNVLNLTRSGLYWQTVDVRVDVATASTDFLANVRGYLKHYVQSHPETFSGDFMLCISGMDRPLHVILSLWIEFSYRPNNLTRLFQDIGRTHEALCQALIKHGASSSGVQPASVHFGKVPTFLSRARENTSEKTQES